MKMVLYRIIVPALVTLSLTFLGGCASTPQASPGRDAQAKQFISYPSSSTIYVYRTDYGGEADRAVLYVDGRLIGETLPQAFFRVDVNPGKHLLEGIAHDQGTLSLETRPGRIYFVEQNVIGGNSFFKLVDPKVAKSWIVACCQLLENWAPGQRPLLR